MAEPNDQMSRTNIVGSCGAICAVIALIAWAFIIVAGLVLSKEYDAVHRDFADLNSLEKLIHAFKTISAGGVFGILALATGGFCSIMAILLSGIGLAFEPRRVAFSGLVLGIVSVLAGITFLVLLVLTVSRMNAP